MQSALKEIVKVNKEFKLKFKRGYGNGLVEPYKLKDAKIAYVCMGSMCTTVRGIVDTLRAEGKKVGMIKLKCFSCCLIDKTSLTSCMREERM